jgi:ABC-type glutathione transport system ATPase component
MPQAHIPHIGRGAAARWWRERSGKTTLSQMLMGACSAQPRAMSGWDGASIAGKSARRARCCRRAASDGASGRQSALDPRYTVYDSIRRADPQSSEAPPRSGARADSLPPTGAWGFRMSTFPPGGGVVRRAAKAGVHCPAIAVSPRLVIFDER